MHELDELLQAFGETGADKGIFANKEIAHLAASGHNSLFRHITKSLARKLIIAIGLLIIIGGGISWYILIHNQKNVLNNNAIQHTASYSELIKKAPVTA